jgi:hypothetical protein
LIVAKPASKANAAREGGRTDWKMKRKKGISFEGRQSERSKLRITSKVKKNPF